MSVLQMGRGTGRHGVCTTFTETRVSTNPSRGAIKQTSHESDATDALGTGDGDASGVGLDGVISQVQNAK